MFRSFSHPPPAQPHAPPSILRLGRNCWRLEQARRAAFLVDGEAIFSAMRAALIRARESIYILGWDIDSRMRLMPGGANDGYPEPLAEFLDAIASRNRVKTRILSWDFAMLFALEREWLPAMKLDWRTCKRLSFRLDDRHPFGASHHQKVIVIDDCVAFVGGMDLTRSRWDTSEHAETEPRRCDPDGKPYRPFHDVQMVVEGEVAAALGDLARERWRRATGQTVQRRRPPRTVDTPWPPHVEPDLADVRIGIARTEPQFEGFAGVQEIRALHEDAIRSARHAIFLENQYFSSSFICEQLSARLAEEKSPEVVLLTPQRESGWLEENTMGVLRVRLFRRLSEADRNGRFRSYCPVLPGTHTCLNVHSKVMTVDDGLLTVGSANLSNRSMGFDTECNLVIEAAAQGQRAEATRRAIAGLRNRLLGEHLGVSPREVSAQTAARGSLIAAIEALRGNPRTLAAAQPVISPEIEALLPGDEYIDPERALEPERFIAEFVPADATPRVKRHWFMLAGAVLGLAGLAALWRFTPLREWIDVASLVRFGEWLKAQPATPLLVILAYVLAGLVVMPVMLLIAVTGMVFGPLMGALYAVTGSLASAAGTFIVGRLLGRDLVRRLAGPRINRLSRQLSRRGLLAMAAVRLLPVAPFSVVNVVAGAANLRLRDFLIGTFIGMLPGIVTTVVFVDRLAEAIRRPSAMTLLVLACVAALVVGLSLLVRRILQKHGEAA